MRAMKTNLGHLAEGKSRELVFASEAIPHGFAFTTHAGDTGATGRRKLSKIMLFGSCALDDLVEDPVRRCFSDYELLVVMDWEELKDVPNFGRDRGTAA